MAASAPRLDVEIAPARGLEVVAVFRRPEIQYHSVIAVHRLVDNLAVGGTRFRRYESESDAFGDACRLAKAMTYKSALAQLPFGGGKAVIRRPDAPFDRAALFEAHGEAVEWFGGRFCTAGDFGTTDDDLLSIARSTRCVAGHPLGRAGDSGPYTARGVLTVMRAALRVQRGKEEVAGLRVAVQGCGKVGMPLVQLLLDAGASVVVADVDPSRQAAAVARGAVGGDPETILFEIADVLAPCAEGGVLNAESIPRLRAPIVAGGANNQVATDADAERIHEAGILHVPDVVASAGGVISGTMDLLDWDDALVMRKFEELGETAALVLQGARRTGINTERIARAIANSRQFVSTPWSWTVNTAGPKPDRKLQYDRPQCG